MQNALVESFNGRLRDELLNETLFTSLARACIARNEWRHNYNSERPDSALGNLTPVAYAARNASVAQQPGALWLMNDGAQVSSIVASRRASGCRSTCRASAWSTGAERVPVLRRVTAQLVRT